MYDFWTVTELRTFFNSRTRPLVNRFLRNQLAGDVLSLVAYRLRKLQRATRAFTTEREPVLRPVVAFSKTSFKQRSIQIKGNFTKLTYIYTLNVSCIMLVYYFVPHIVSNRYLLFWVSNGHNSVTVQNRTRVYMNFFHHKDLRNHLPQLCPKVVKHPV